MKYEFLIERVSAQGPEFVTHLERWRQLYLKERWSLTVLLTPDRKEAVAFGCKPSRKELAGKRLPTGRAVNGETARPAKGD